MNISNLNLQIVKIDDSRNYRTREGTLNALRELAKIDDDFNGTNGPDYLWSDSKAAGASSNMEYVISRFKNLKDDKDLIERFVHRWMNEDGYYKGYKLDVICDKHGQAEFIALAFLN